MTQERNQSNHPSISCLSIKSLKGPWLFRGMEPSPRDTRTTLCGSYKSVHQLLMESEVKDEHALDFLSVFTLESRKNPYSYFHRNLYLYGDMYTNLKVSGPYETPKNF